MLKNKSKSIKIKNKESPLNEDEEEFKCQICTLEIEEENYSFCGICNELAHFECLAAKGWSADNETSHYHCMACTDQVSECEFCAEGEPSDFSQSTEFREENNKHVRRNSDRFEHHNWL